MIVSKKVRLYKNHKTGIGTWTIWYAGDNLTRNTIHITHSQTVGGAEVPVTEVITEGKQGRSIRDQTIHRMRSRINKQKDKGYVTSVEDAKAAPTNAMGLVQPMLALPIKRVSNIQWEGAVFQTKLNGHRCLVTKQNGEVIAYSRQGKEIPAVTHILKDLRHLPEGMTVDGELYRHNTPLQTIASLVKRKQAETETVNYVMYDVVSNKPYLQRHNMLRCLTDTDKPLSHTLVIPCFRGTPESMQKALGVFISQGYEGLMLRHGAKGYEAGRRSNSLVKVKTFMDEEYTVLDITPSKDGWAVLHMVSRSGEPFKASAPGDVAAKTEVLKNKNDYIGRDVTIQFPEYTVKGVPFQPIAIEWREDL